MMNSKDLWDYEIVFCGECGTRENLLMYNKYSQDSLYHEFMCKSCLRELADMLEHQEAVDEEMGVKDENEALDLWDRNKE